MIGLVREGVAVLSVWALGVSTVVGLFTIARWAFEPLRECFRAFDFRSQVWASLFGVPRPAPLPKRIPAPPVMSPRPDLDAALRAARLRLDDEIDRALAGTPARPEPSAQDIENVITAATRACRTAAAHTDH